MRNWENMSYEEYNTYDNTDIVQQPDCTNRDTTPKKQR